MTRHQWGFLQVSCLLAMLTSATLGWIAWTVATGILYLVSLLGYYLG